MSPKDSYQSVVCHKCNKCKKKQFKHGVRSQVTRLKLQKSFEAQRLHIFEYRPTT